MSESTHTHHEQGPHHNVIHHGHRPYWKRAHRDWRFWVFGWDHGALKGASPGDPYRSTEPVLKPESPQERSGTIANIVFPTGIDRRDDLGAPDRFDVYYGMADNRIGVARLDVPELLPPGRIADAREGTVFSIWSRNCSRRDFRPYSSNTPSDAKLRCFIIAIHLT